MNKCSFSFVLAFVFWLAGTTPVSDASNTSLDRIVSQIDSMFPPLEGVVVSVDKQILTLDLKQGQPIKAGDRFKLIRFGKDIVHPVSKKKIGRRETDLGEAEVIEVRQNFSLAKLMSPTTFVRAGDGVRSPFNEVTFLIAAPVVETTQKIDGNKLRMGLEKKLTGHPRFKVTTFELGLWLLENNLSLQGLLQPKQLDKLNDRVKADYLMVPSVHSVKKKFVLSYKLYSTQTGHLEKEAKILSDELSFKQTEQGTSSKDGVQANFTRPGDNRLVQFVSKQEFMYKIVDLDVGDVNGDGREELVVIAPNRMVIYEYRHKKLKQVASFRAENENHIFLGVDVGDINQNGRDEIFITDQLGDSLSSFVLEARPGKKRLQKIWDNVNLYFRIIHPFGSGPTLLAQAPGSRGPFHGPISKLAYRKGRYSARSKLNLPDIHGVDFILYGLTSADINGDGKREIAMLDKNHKLRVYSTRGRVLVHSEDYYGRDPRSFDLSVREEAGVVREGEPVQYRGRLQLIRQGKNRFLLLPKNTSTGGSLAPGLMLDTHGSITFLKLTREGLEKSFEVKKQKGYIAAYGVTNANKNNPESLHMATVVKDGGMTGGKVRSTIYTYSWRN